MSDKIVKSYTPDKNFDWDLYEDGYNGGNILVVNKNVKCRKGDKVYCHEPYAQEMADRISSYFGGKVFGAKDSADGAIYTVDEIKPVSDHEIIIDSNNGMSSVVDMNKETQFIRTIGVDSVKDFIEALQNDPKFKQDLLKADLFAKVVDKNRVSIWDGYKAKVESCFFEELNSKNGPKYGYNAKIVSLNNGGYNVNIMGVECFLPSSLAASGPIADYSSLLGKDVKVCIVNYSAVTKNFVVSHKKYLEITLPTRIAEELYIGKNVFVKVTGISKNGLFCAIKDDNGDYVFASLMHRSTMSSDMESSFDRHEFSIGDMFKAYIHKINWIDETNCRIVIGDTMPVVEKEPLEKEGEND